MPDFLPYGRQTIEADDIAAVTEALQSDFLTTGPRVDAFESALRQASGSTFAVACSNGTAALHLASLTLNLGPHDQVIVPSVTFLATANAPRFLGAEIVFADVDPDTGLLTAATLAEALARAPRARAVFPVHLNGAWCDMPAIARVARDRGLLIIEDACHALGTTYHIVSEGETITGLVGDCRWSDLTCFSFHPVKAIAMGEGGAITAKEQHFDSALRLGRSHGLTRNVADFRNSDLAFGDDGEAAPWYYEMHEPGYNYRVPDVLCALGISQLAKLDRFVARRRELAALYDAALAPLAQIARPVPSSPTCRSAYHLYVVAIDFTAAGTTRYAVVEALRSSGIGTQVHYVPVHTQPYYRKHSGDTKLPGARAYYERALSLPLFPAMSDDDVPRVVTALRAALERV